MEVLAKYMYKFRFPALFIITALAIVSLFNIDIKYDNSNRAWFSSKDSKYLKYQEFKEDFNEGRKVIIGIKCSDIFSVKTLKYIKQKTEEIKMLDNFVSIKSLANANMISTKNENFSVEPILNNISDKNIKDIRNRIKQDNVLKNYLISKDEKYTAFYITFNSMNAEQTRTCINKIEQIMEKGKPLGIDIFITGDIKLKQEFNRFTLQNQTVLPIFVLIVIFILLLLILKSFYQSIIIIASTIITVLITLGMHSFMGFSFNVISGMVIPLVVILSISIGIHIIEYYLSVLSCSRIAFIKTISYITVPSFIAALTTSLGLISLVISKIPAVKQFAIIASLGLICSFFTGIIFVTTLLSFKQHKYREDSCAISKGIKFLYFFIKKQYKLILILSFGICVFLGVFIFKIKVETNQIEWFPKDEKFYKDSMIIDQNLCGLSNIEVSLTGNENEFINLEMLKSLDRISKKIKKMTYVKKVITVSDYIKNIHKSINNINEIKNDFPENEDMVLQELFLFTLSEEGREDLNKIITSDYSTARMSIKITNMSTKDNINLVKKISDLLNKEFKGKDLKIDITGIAYLYNVMYSYLIESQIKGFLFAFLLITIVSFFTFKSVRYGLLSMIPNIIPIIFVFGIMGIFGIPLNTGTIMIASVALGIAIDDTIHFLFRFRKELLVSRHGAVKRAMLSSGKAIGYTTLINVIGFSVLCISSFEPTQSFGLLTGITLVCAVIADILILPAILIFINSNMRVKS